IEESRAVWAAIFGPNWVFEKLPVKEFEDIDGGRLMDEALTPSLFSQSRVLIVANAEKVTKKRAEDLAALQGVSNSSLKVILLCSSVKSVEALMKGLPVVAIDPLKTADVARWLVERHGL